MSTLLYSDLNLHHVLQVGSPDEEAGVLAALQSVRDCWEDILEEADWIPALHPVRDRGQDGVEQDELVRSLQPPAKSDDDLLDFQVIAAW